MNLSLRMLALEAFAVIVLLCGSAAARPASHVRLLQGQASANVDQTAQVTLTGGRAGIRGFRKVGSGCHTPACALRHIPFMHNHAPQAQDGIGCVNIHANVRNCGGISLSAKLAR